MTNTAHNLGYHLCVNGKPEQALKYLEKSRNLSIKTSNRKLEASCDMSIGICYFFLQQYELAIQYYDKAATIARELGNQPILIRAHCNLAEAYAELEYDEKMRHHFSEGLRQATAYGDEGAKQDLNALLETYPQLANKPHKAELSTRQQQALNHCLLYTSPSPRDLSTSRMPSSA